MTGKLIYNWNIALVDNLKWQSNNISDTFFNSKINERVNFINESKYKGYSREELLEKFDKKIFDSKTTIIHTTDIHDEYAYVFNSDILYKYSLKKGEWELIKKCEFSKELLMEFENQLSLIDKCSDENFELPLFLEVSITSFYSRDNVKATYIMKLCKQHIDVLTKLYAF